jgi:hypothetical protein
MYSSLDVCPLQRRKETQRMGQRDQMDAQKLAGKKRDGNNVETLWFPELGRPRWACSRPHFEVCTAEKIHTRRPVQVFVFITTTFSSLLRSRHTTKMARL